MKVCVPCAQNCIKCNENQCLQCHKDFSLDYKGKCIQTFVCDFGEYFDGDLQVCRRCHPNCYQCDGPGPHHCLECRKDEALSEGVCKKCSEVTNVNLVDGVCLGGCGDGVRSGHNE